MADFNYAFPFFEKNEGGYVDDPNDSGGETYRGISRKNWPQWSGWAIIDAHKPLKKGQIINDADLEKLIADFYKENFWDKMRGDDLANLPFATYFGDWFVMSETTAVNKLQEVLGIAPQTGHFGDITLQRANDAGEPLLERIHTRRLQFFHDHVAAVPKDEEYLNGWLNRANNLYATLCP